MMPDLAIYAVATFFLLMGLVGLVKPASITAYFSATPIPVDMRNEVRAVYGGFGVAVCAVLIAATRFDDLRAGILVAIAVAVYGMAGGRIVSWAIERTEGKYPIVYFVGEIVMASLLIYGWKG